MSPGSQAALALVAALIVVALGAYAFGRSAHGRRFGRRFTGPLNNVVVRCRAGHLFTTIWLPGVSLKAIRLGLVRFQHCPVGSHWTFVTPVDRSDLTDVERRIAETNPDVRLP